MLKLVFGVAFFHFVTTVVDGKVSLTFASENDVEIMVDLPLVLSEGAPIFLSCKVVTNENPAADDCPLVQDQSHLMCATDSSYDQPLDAYHYYYALVIVALVVALAVLARPLKLAPVVLKQNVEELEEVLVSSPASPDNHRESSSTPSLLLRTAAPRISNNSDDTRRVSNGPNRNDIQKSPVNASSLPVGTRTISTAEPEFCQSGADKSQPSNPQTPPTDTSSRASLSPPSPQPTRRPLRPVYCDSSENSDSDEASDNHNNTKDSDSGHYTAERGYNGAPSSPSAYSTETSSTGSSSPASSLTKSPSSTRTRRICAPEFTSSDTSESSSSSEESDDSCDNNAKHTGRIRSKDKSVSLILQLCNPRTRPTWAPSPRKYVYSDSDDDSDSDEDNDCRDNNGKEFHSAPSSPNAHNTETLPIDSSSPAISSSKSPSPPPTGTPRITSEPAPSDSEQSGDSHDNNVNASDDNGRNSDIVPGNNSAPLVPQVFDTQTRLTDSSSLAASSSTGTSVPAPNNSYNDDDCIDNNDKASDDDHDTVEDKGDACSNIDAQQ